MEDNDTRQTEPVSDTEAEAPDPEGFWRDTDTDAVGWPVARPKSTVPEVVPEVRDCTAGAEGGR
jgi:hypothetical protein